MQIILLSGGSGKRLWPLSNDSRSKQFMKLLDRPDGSRESMVQRIVRQLRESGINDDITVATSASQRDVIDNQLGPEVHIVTEPERRRTFPAIALATAYLALEKKCPPDETVIVLPCDPYTDEGYFNVIAKMAEAVANNAADLVLMGVKPTYPSAKYGYILPDYKRNVYEALAVSRFIEKPDVPEAEKLIADGALWNGGVFAFRLRYMTAITNRYVRAATFDEMRKRYGEFPSNSFDYEVAEKAVSVAVVPFGGPWKDLGTWLTLTDELNEHTIGNVVMDNDSHNTHVVNELELPIMCIGAQNLVIAASSDGILVSEKSKSENIKMYADRLIRRPMYEERRWGTYKVVDMVEFPDGYKALTKQLRVNAGKSLSYQRHFHRDEVWIFIAGRGRLVIDDVEREIGRGETVYIPKGTKHCLKAIDEIVFIEVQTGDLLIEEDIERMPWNWE